MMEYSIHDEQPDNDDIFRCEKCGEIFYIADDTQEIPSYGARCEIEDYRTGECLRLFLSHFNVMVCIETDEDLWVCDECLPWLDDGKHTWEKRKRVSEMTDKIRQIKGV